MTPLEARALNAYFKEANRQIEEAGGLGEPIQPRAPTTCEVEGKKYVVLSNVRGVLAVYRVRVVNGKEVLKGLKRYPKEIIDGFGVE